MRRKCRRIVLVGPSDRSDPRRTSQTGDSIVGHTSRTSVFGAYRDKGRIITRRTDPDPIWAELASQRIARYGEIIRESGVD